MVITIGQTGVSVVSRPGPHVTKSCVTIVKQRIWDNRIIETNDIASETSTSCGKIGVRRAHDPTEYILDQTQRRTKQVRPHRRRKICITIPWLSCQICNKFVNVLPLYNLCISGLEAISSGNVIRPITCPITYWKSITYWFYVVTVIQWWCESCFWAMEPRTITSPLPPGAITPKLHEHHQDNYFLMKHYYLARWNNSSELIQVTHTYFTRQTKLEMYRTELLCTSHTVWVELSEAEGLPL
jgi:hypothetical protein